MIFWVVTAVIVVVWALLTIGMFIDDWSLGFAVLFLGGILAFLVWLLVACGVVLVGLNHAVGANSEAVEETPLKSLGSDSSVEGRFYFLGGGHVDGKRVLSYIGVNEDGSFTPGQVDGSSSRIHESDGSAPVMLTRFHIADHWWVSPAVPLFDTYEFTIPTGSVAEGYTVTP